ncbi:hypothetical protein Tco_0194018 [Tanacetum coccineum]
MCRSMAAVSTEDDGYRRLWRLRLLGYQVWKNGGDTPLTEGVVPRLRLVTGKSPKKQRWSIDVLLVDVAGLLARGQMCRGYASDYCGGGFNGDVRFLI